MTDEEIVKAHDDVNSGRALPSTYFIDELRRREAERAEAASYKLATESQNLAKRMYSLALANMVVAVVAVAVVVAVAAIIVGIVQANSSGTSPTTPPSTTTQPSRSSGGTRSP
jgi:hypothetical protein